MTSEELRSIPTPQLIDEAVRRFNELVSRVGTDQESRLLTFSNVDKFSALIEATKAWAADTA